MEAYSAEGTYLVDFGEGEANETVPAKDLQKVRSAVRPSVRRSEASA
jgi:hypothetical protein